MPVDATRGKRKLAALRKAASQFKTNILQDGGAFFILKLTDEVLNGAYINRITGMLVRSQVLIPLRDAVRIHANLSIAPYAPFVASYSLRTFGKDYLRLTEFFYGDTIKKRSRQEWNRLKRQINRGAAYVYQNPFDV